MCVIAFSVARGLAAHEVINGERDHSLEFDNPISAAPDQIENAPECQQECHYLELRCVRVEAQFSG
jgi:hypothetical protein